MKFEISLVWFRRDLRLHDHAALYTALRESRRVYCAFVFDREILDDVMRFRAWCEARTGYPLIDAAMRQIDQTGYMHRPAAMRVRISASQSGCAVADVRCRGKVHPQIRAGARPMR